MWSIPYIANYNDNKNSCYFYYQGVGGAVHLPKGYLKKAYQLVREKGGVCIADEVSYETIW